jgi:hypothetical protein
LVAPALLKAECERDGMGGGQGVAGAGGGVGDEGRQRVFVKGAEENKEGVMRKRAAGVGMEKGRDAGVKEKNESKERGAYAYQEKVEGVCPLDAIITPTCSTGTFLSEFPGGCW